MAAAGAAIRPVMSPEATPSTAQAAGSLISKWLAITCSTSSSGAMKSSTRNSKEQPFEAAAGTCLQQQQQQQQTPVRLSWKAVTVTAWNMRGETVPVLRGVTGFAEPGKLTAIMGPSGSGKTTLLDALCAKLAKNMVQSGEVCVNGCPTRNFIAAYVTQEVTLLGTLTVRETLWYSSLLRLPDSTSRQHRRRIVEDAISGMGLGKCADTAVGNWHLRGLSGGERRRLSIAVEILTQPPLLFLDEPTSGLDSAAAYFVTKKLQTLAAQGCTVVCVMHQPGREVFQLLDSLVLMSGGRTIYFGDVEAANLHFAEAGFPCPGGRNPLDHYLRVINEDFPLSIEPEEDECQAGDVVPEHTPVVLSPCTSQSVTEVLAKAYEASPAAAHTRARIRSLKCNREEEVTLRSQVGSRASFWTQLRTLTRRSFVNMVRDMGYYWLRLVIYIAICVCLGTLYFRLDNTYRSIEARGATIFFVVGIVTFMAIASFPSFVEDIKVFYQERMNGHYGVAAYVLANTLSSVPMIALLAVCSGAVCYLLVGLHPGPDRFAYFVLNLCFCMLAVESLMMAVTSVVQSYSVGITTATCVVGVFLLVAGFFRLPSDIPKPFWQIPVMYNAFHYYAFQGMMENEFFGLSFASDNPSGLPRISGEAVLEQREVDYKGRGKWANLATVVAMVLLYRLVFFSAIKLSEKMPAWTRRAIPCVRTCWARRPRPAGRPATTRSTSPATRHS